MNADDLAKILDELGKRLGPTGEHVFELAVRQVYIEALTWGVVGVLALVAATYLWRRARRMTHMMADYDAPMVQLVASLVAVIGVLCIVFTVPSVLNPEYAALRDILSTVHP